MIYNCIHFIVPIVIATSMSQVFPDVKSAELMAYRNPIVVVAQVEEPGVGELDKFLVPITVISVLKGEPGPKVIWIVDARQKSVRDQIEKVTKSREPFLLFGRQQEKTAAFVAAQNGLEQYIFDQAAIDAKHLLDFAMRPITDLDKAERSLKEFLCFAKGKTLRTHIIRHLPGWPTQELNANFYALVLPSLEEVAEEWIDSKSVWVRTEGVLALRHFRSEANELIVRTLLNDRETVTYRDSETGEETKREPVREAAKSVLRSWGAGDSSRGSYYLHAECPGQ